MVILRRNEPPRCAVEGDVVGDLRARTTVLVVAATLLWCPASTAEAAVRCVEDPVGDVSVERFSEGPLPPTEPFDQVEVCVDYDDDLTVTVEFLGGSDPTGQPDWEEAGAWAVEVFGEFNDGSVTIGFVGFASEGGQLRGYVGDVEGQSEICPAPPAFFDGTRVRIGPFRPDGCLAETGSIKVDGGGGGWFSDRGRLIDFGVEGAVERRGLRPNRRIAGGDRISTAVAVSTEAFPDRAASVYLARADQFADAVAAGSLSDGPVLLVPSCGAVPAAVRDEIDRLGPDRVVSLGGEQAICQELLDEAAGDRPADRLAGNGRIGTALAISRARFPTGSPIAYLARADVEADALAAGVLDGGPILLVPSCGTLPTDVEEELRRLAPDEVVALGGDAAVCPSLLSSAQEGAGAAGQRRLAGTDRSGTALAIARERFPTGPVNVYLANGARSADAVVAGALRDGPILLVDDCGAVPDDVIGYVDQVAGGVIGLGGSSALCDLSVHYAASG